MEAMGYIFGMAAMSFAIIAWGQIGILRNDLNSLKEKLKLSGVLNDKKID